MQKRRITSRPGRAWRARGVRKPQNVGVIPTPGGHATPRGFTITLLFFACVWEEAGSKGGGVA